MKEVFQYLVPIAVVLISNLVSYFIAVKKSHIDIQILKESNKHEIERLVEAHKHDLDTLAQTHKMELEKMEIEHKHQLDLKERDMQSMMTSQLMSPLIGLLLSTPDFKQLIEQAVKKGTNK